MTTLRTLAAVALVVTFALVGCLPIELEVSKDGQVLVPRQEGFFALDSDSGKVTRVHKPAAGDPVFARFAPDSKHILAVSQTGSGANHVFEWVSLADGSAKKLHAGTNTSYVTISPDGKTAAFARISDQSVKLRDGGSQNLPELHLIDLEAGKRTAVKDVGPIASIHRWFPDSASLLLFQIVAKPEEGNLRKAELSRWDIAAGKATVLAVALGGDNVFLDLSPDGKRVLFTAATAGKPGEELSADKDDPKLFELNIETGLVRSIGRDASYALFSPDGKHALVASKADDGLLKLEVADGALAKFTTVAQDAVGQVGGPGDQSSVYPAWLDKDRIVYLAQRAVYGRAGKNLEMVFINADGANRQSRQTTLDEAAKAEK